MLRLHIDCGAVRAGVGDVAHRLQRVQVEDCNLSCRTAAGYVESPPGIIRIYIVEAALAANLLRLQYLVRPGPLRETTKRHNCDYARQHERNSFHEHLPI